MMTTESTPPPQILLIEDDDDVRDELAYALNQHGYQVLAVSDGAEGLERMRTDRPDLVVLDLMMPAMSGWQVRLEQRRDPAVANTPVIAISASSHPTAAAIDADAFLQKPFSATMLAEAIDRVLQERAQKAAAAAPAQMASLGTLAAAVAHEINNPLTYVLLHLNRLVRLLPANDRLDAAQVASLITGAIEGAERIRSVTRAVGTFAHVGNGGGASLIDVRSALDAALRVTTSDISHRARLVRADGETPFVHAAPGLLALAFLDLLTDAVDALGESDLDRNEIRVTTGIDDHGWAVIDVADTRPPTSPRRADALMVSREITRALGGDLESSDRPGGGAHRRLRLPPATPAAARH